MLAYLMPFNALLIAVCLYYCIIIIIAHIFLAIDLCKCSLFSCFAFGLMTHSLFSSNNYSLNNVQCF